MSAIGGMAWGMTECIVKACQGKEVGIWTVLWDNALDKAMIALQDWSTKNMTNYRSRSEQFMSFKDKLSTANFWTNDILVNLGFVACTALRFASLFIF